MIVLQKQSGSSINTSEIMLKSTNKKLNSLRDKQIELAELQALNQRPMYMKDWIVKLDANGTIQWDKTIGGNGEDELYALEPTTDNGYIAGGRSASGRTDGARCRSERRP